MKLAVVIFALVAAVSAQSKSDVYKNGLYPNGQYDPFNRYDPHNRYDPYNRYDSYNYNRYNPYSTPSSYYNNKYSPYRYNNKYPYGSSTPAPFRYRPVTSTVAPEGNAAVGSTIAPHPASIAPHPASIAPHPASIPVAGKYTDDPHAEILRFSNDNGPDGSYAYSYETSNGIAAQEQGAPRDLGGVAPIVAQGAFSWIAPEGENVAISYTADENGYHPVGDAIPTPHPQIQRALAYLSKFVAEQK